MASAPCLAGTLDIGFGDILVANSAAGNILVVDPATGDQALLVGGFENPTGVVQDASGDLLVVDNTASGGTLKRVAASTGAITTISSGGFFGGPGTVSNSPALEASGDVVVISGAPNGLRNIFRIDPVSGAQTLINNDILQPRDIDIKADGNLIVVSHNDEGGGDCGVGCGGAVIEVNATTGAKTVIAVDPNGGANPNQAAINGDGDYFVSDFTSEDIHLVTPSGGSTEVTVLSPEVPRSIVVEADGMILVGSDGTAPRISRVNPATGATTVLTEGNLISNAKIEIATVAVSIPTVGEWGLIAMGLLLAGALAFVVHRMPPRVATRPHPAA